jgi:acyl-CoA synthetase (AMP-forming)/AMP-acid ligase II
LIPAILARAARHHAGATAVVEGDRSLTYGELAGRVAAFANRLRAAGLRPGDRVALLAPNSLLFLESYFAAAHAGLVLVPLNFRSHPEGLSRVLAHAEARLLVAAPRFEALATAAAWDPESGAPPRLLVADPAFDAELDHEARRGPASAAHESRPADPAHLYYTSGTTGDPKGVILTHQNVASHARLAAAALKLAASDVWAHIAPMFHLADAWATFAITDVGGRHVMVPDFEPGPILDLLADGVTLTNLVPTMLGDLVHRTDAAARQYRSLRLMLSGGAPIAPALVEKVMATFRCDYVQTYGLTETSPYLTMSLLPERLAALPPAEQFALRCRTGRPLEGVEVRVVRDDGSDVSPDGREVGEVICRGETVTPGYWRNPAATESAFRDGWLLTGDLANVDGEGFLQIVDRRKDVIKTGGETVFSTEVEKILHGHPAVLEAAVVGVPHERWGEAVVAAVVARAGSSAGEAALIDHCRAHLGSHQVPKRIVFVTALPRTGSGKIAKRLLRDRLTTDPRQSGASSVGVVALVVLLALLGGAAWWLLHERAGPQKAAPSKPAEAKHEAAPAVPEVEAKEFVVERSAEPIEPRAEPAGPLHAPDSYLEALSGVRGRLVEEDGSPIPGKRVELYELKLEPLLGSFDLYFNAMPEELGHLDVAATVSGEDGVFALKGALAEAFHLLAIDFGGMRPSFRILDVGLERGVLYDLGDIPLAPALTLTGTVVDEEGVPIAGARVRALPQLPIPPPVLEAGLQDIRPDSVGLFLVSEMKTVFELPAWAHSLFDRLPIPTTLSGSDGKFTLAGAPTGVITVLCDKPGRLGLVKPGIPTARKKEHAVGNLALSSGRTISGRVVAGKTPVAGARVYAGAAIEIDKEHVAIGQPAGRTDADGRFALSGVPVNGGPVVAIQLVEKGPFELFGPFDRDDVVIELPPRAPLTVRVHDAAGKPVEHAEIRFADAGPVGTAPFMLTAHSLQGNMKEEAGGAYRFDALPLGKWEAIARADGFGVGRRSFDFTGDGAEIEVVLPPEFRAEVRVVDAASGAPVEYALVSALTEKPMFGIPTFVASARTGADGRCELRRLPAEGKLIVVRAQHSKYCVAATKIEAPADPAVPVPVELKATGGGTLAGRVVMAGEAPPKRLMLAIEQNGDHAALEQAMPRLALTEADGSFRAAHLAAGKYSYHLFTRFLYADPLSFLPEHFREPDELASGDASIEEGKETSLVIDATPLDQLEPGIVRGVVRHEGHPAPGLTVNVSGRGHAQAKTDDAGRFEVADVKPGDVELEVTGQDGDAYGTLYSSSFKLLSGEARDVAIDLRYVEVTVFVHDSQGRPVSGAQVSGNPKVEPHDATKPAATFGVWGQTGADGKAKFSLANAGAWSFEAQSGKEGRGSAAVDVPARGLDHPIEVVLDPGVRCAGRIEFEGIAPSAEQTWWISIEPAGDSGHAPSGAEAEVDEKQKTFTVSGLAPGTWRATFFSPDLKPMMSQEFTLTSQGDTNLVLRFKEF